MSIPHNRLYDLARGLTTAALEPKIKITGEITSVSAAEAHVIGLSPFLKLGDLVLLETQEQPQIAETIRVDRNAAIVKPFDSALKAGPGMRVSLAPPLVLRPDLSWRGRTLNPLGIPIDGKGPLPPGPRGLPLDRSPPKPMTRHRVKRRIATGVRAVDLFMPLCAGQRTGIFAGSGVGKSTLLGMLAGAGGFDTAVIALVGERGREVREFLEDVIGDRAAKTVAVVSTSDESPMMRRLAPKAALTIAEFFRDEGQSVLLVFDSITRYAHAARDVALAAGEPPVARGYPPSVFTELPKLLERAGPGEESVYGTITGVFSVLVDGDDHDDPVADTLRATLDGHIVLSRAIAAGGRYPAIDILASISRLAGQVWTEEERRLIPELRGMVLRYEETKDLRLIGAYKAGSDPSTDRACELVPRLYAALQQGPNDAAGRDVLTELGLAPRSAL